MISISILSRAGRAALTLSSASVFRSDRLARAERTNGCRQGAGRASGGGYVVVVMVCSMGPDGPVMIAVSTEVRYPLKLRNFLVFYGPQAIRSLTGS
jgi:hypothetical protein